MYLFVKAMRKERTMRKFRIALASLGLAMILLTASTLFAQAPVAPIPSQILTAKKVFISNAGGASDTKMWSGGPAQPYNELYAALKSWGRYELVATPADADLILQISFTDTLTDVGGSQASGPVSFTTAQLNLDFLDLKTHVILWTLNEKTSTGHLEKGRDQALEKSINALVDDLKVLTAQPGAAAK
jgi:hypothetical protein